MRGVIHTNSKIGVLTLGDIRRFLKNCDDSHLSDDCYITAEPELRTLMKKWSLRRPRRHIREIEAFSDRVHEFPEED
jgi:hypothetical protein